MHKCIIVALLFGTQICMSSEVHTPWRLEGAQQRIEEIRKGECVLQLRLPNGRSVPVKTAYSLNQTRHAFNFGGSLAADWEVPRQDWYPEFKTHFAQLFNYATIDFYWAVHAQKRGEWDYRADSRAKLDWAKGAGMRLRGHPLMWHEVAPKWIESSTRSVASLDGDIMKHIRMLVKDYPEIDEWDLYNETPGIRLKDPELGARRWVESLGGPGPTTEVIVDAVREIQPNGRFIVNHFSGSDPEYHEQIEYCLAQNVSFDAIGVQTHMHHQGDTYTESRLWNALEQFSEYGKPLQLSEISILSCELFPSWDDLSVWEKEISAAKQAGAPIPLKPSTPEWERYQAELTRDFYTLAFSHPSVEALIWWTITDLKPWRGMPAGLLDAEGQPKPVYHVLDQLINQDWTTHLDGETAMRGEVQFRGYYGSYHIELEHNGQTFVGEFEFLNDSSEVQEIVLHASGERQSSR